MERTLYGLWRVATVLHDSELARQKSDIKKSVAALVCNSEELVPPERRARGFSDNQAVGYSIKCVESLILIYQVDKSFTLQESDQLVRIASGCKVTSKVAIRNPPALAGTCLALQGRDGFPVITKDEVRVPLSGPSSF